MSVNNSFGNGTLFDNETIFDNETVMDDGVQKLEVPILKKALDVLLISIVLLIMLAMGSEMTLKEILKHVKRPISIIIGMASQFVILPLCGFGLSHAVKLPPNVAVGMLVLSCCPGGTMSNLFTYWIDGDVPLSVMMTTFSTIFAFGMMPLNLWIYSRSWTSAVIVIPYVKICITLATILGPVIIGMLCRRFLPKVAEVVVKVGSIAGLLGIAISVTIQSILFPDIYTSGWNVWLSAALFPLIGLSIGFIFAQLTRRDMKTSKAIAFETGSQNVAVAMTVLFLTFPFEILGQATAFPLLYVIIMLTQYGTLCGCYKIYKKRFASKEEEKEDVEEAQQLKTNQDEQNQSQIQETVKI